VTVAKLRAALKGGSIRLTKPSKDGLDLVAVLWDDRTFRLYSWDWIARPSNSAQRHDAWLDAQTRASEIEGIVAIGQGNLVRHASGSYIDWNRMMSEGKVLRRSFWWKGVLGELTAHALEVGKDRLRQADCNVCRRPLCDTKHAASKAALKAAKRMGLDTDRVELRRTGHANERYEVAVPYSQEHMGGYKRRVGVVSRRANMDHSWQARSDRSLLGLLGDFRELRHAVAEVLYAHSKAKS
jgi:hypothetical protein